VIQGMSLNSPLSDCITAGYGTNVRVRAMDFGTAAQAHMHAERNGAIWVESNYSISGGAQYHWYIRAAGLLFVQGGDIIHAPPNPGPVITIVGTPAFSTAFAAFGQLAVIHSRFISFVRPGRAPGKRYDGGDNGVFSTGTGGTLVLPGTVAGTVTTGALYD
jgi:hypothetical protein